MTIPRSASGSAKPTTLTADIGTGDLLLAVEALTGTWADTAKGSFAATLNLGKDDEERITVASYTSTQLTLTSDGRGADGYAAQDHSAGCTVTPGIDGASWQDAQQHVIDSTRNDHKQYPFLIPGTVGHPTTGTWVTNDAIIDENGQLWVCSSGGTPGTWAAVGGLASVYPVGSVFLGTVSTNPATLLGFGTWSAIGQGRVLAGVGTGTDIHSVTHAVTEGAGGDSVGEYAHTLASAESGLPDHTHLAPADETSQGGYLANGLAGAGTGYTGAAPGTGADWAYEQTGHVAGGAEAAGSSHNNIQPYFGVYAWARTA